VSDLVTPADPVAWLARPDRPCRIRRAAPDPV